MEDNMLNNIKRPAHKRSIRDIPLPGEKKPASNSINLTKRTDDIKATSAKISQTSTKKSKSKKTNKKAYIWSASIVVLLLIIYFVSNIFHSATVNIVSRTETIPEYSNTINLVPVEDVIENLELGYRELAFAKTVSEVVPANGEEEVSEKATGTITVYNLYTTAPQRLIRNTRFESEDGLIYRTPESIEVPGYTESGGEKIPGSLNIEIVADQPGEEYNISTPTEFTIPGFEGTEAFEFFVANNATNIEGGFDGIRKIIADEDLQLAQDNLSDRITDELLKELDNQIPSDVIALYSPDSYSYSPVNQTESNDNSATLSMSGEVNVVIVDKTDLAQTIAAREIIDYQPNQEVEISNIDDLQISLNQGLDTSINIFGDIEMKWNTDRSKLAKELAGKENKDFKSIISNYAGIVSVTTKFFPFWKSTFPENPEKIKIEEN
jgi:hypothetical protein